MMDVLLNTEEREAAIDEMKRSLDRCKDFDKRAILMFSGGRDSTIVAAAYCEAFPDGELHLLFIDNGVLLNKNKPLLQYYKLLQLYPGYNLKIEIKNVEVLMNKAAIREIEKDFIQERFSSLMVCVACKLIMCNEAIKYAKETSITTIMDGYSQRQSMYPEQTPLFLEERDKLFLSNKLQCVSPLYSFFKEKDQVIRVLNAFHVDEKSEASCMFADSFSEASESDLKRYITKSLPLIINNESERK